MSPKLKESGESFGESGRCFLFDLKSYKTGSCTSHLNDPVVLESLDILHHQWPLEPSEPKNLDHLEPLMEWKNWRAEVVWGHARWEIRSHRQNVP